MFNDICKHKVSSNNYESVLTFAMIVYRGKAS